MKKRSAEDLNLDVQKLIEMLNGALCEEWLAYYQYWTGAYVLVGPMRGEIQEELFQHAEEELSHADKVINRIIQLGGTPVVTPAQWQKMARCQYESPTDGYVDVILEQNLRGERCAIKRYEEIAAYTHAIDYTTYSMAVDILEEELEHESDIIDFQNDLATMKAHFTR